jgi:hypothetical protein
MAGSGLASVFTSGVGRRILGLFLLAGIVPVIFTAYLAYHEIGRGLEQEVNKNLRESSKSYGVDILTHLRQASDKSAALLRIVD